MTRRWSFSRALGALCFTAGVVFCTASAVSCSSPCDTGYDEARVVEVRDIAPQGNTYASSDWEGPYFPFPAGQRYEFYHGLGRAPTVVVVNVSFEEYPLPGANVSQASGDASLIEAVDAEKIQVRNDTCSELWVRVSAVAP
ncbi:MAG: hypothetical protein KIT72_04425 [Polyangiaceae bacterium]|nr:hypothetical protein [Polyangiaceae bacterium]MCW5789649.1 hypothetical protein [Polyangiaceae bacterium]